MTLTRSAIVDCISQCGSLGTVDAPNDVEKVAEGILLGTRDPDPQAWTRRGRHNVDRYQCILPGGVVFASWATAAVIRRHTAAPLSSPAATSSSVRAAPSSSALS